MSHATTASVGGTDVLRRKVDLFLITHGLLPVSLDHDPELASQWGGLLGSFREQTRLLSEHRCPIDRRIESFLADNFKDLPGEPLRLPSQALSLNEPGLARELSLPSDKEEFSSPLLTSYRVYNGVLHNPKSDRRTTEGTFHVAEGGMPIPGDKRAVPKGVFAELLRHAVVAPDDLALLPYTATRAGAQARCFVSLLLRPTVCPDIPGVTPGKSMEIRFFVPGSLVANLDFVETIFGNAGDPFLPENDAALDSTHWTGHTGCVILAPHLTTLTKKQLGLPHFDQATVRQKRDKMCWRDEKELYNDGVAFKVTFRTTAGVILTLIADNYFGYCKKEVKTQISFSANLSGNYEEEHAGGAVAFASYALGYEYQTISYRMNGRTFSDVARDYSRWIDVKPEGYGVDKNFPNLIYIPHDARASTIRQDVSWMLDGKEQSLPLAPGKVFITPSGYKITMEKHPSGKSWRLIGTVARGAFCHKPCTVSGGGKSEISKSLRDYMLVGPVFVADIEKDLQLVDELCNHDYSDRWCKDSSGKPDYAKHRTRPLLSPDRSLGSVIKLLTPSPEYNDSYNTWLSSIPDHVFAIMFIIKRFYSDDWGQDWASHFGVDIVNGAAGNELKLDGRKLIGQYLRVGLTDAREWRTFKVRQDFSPAVKLQTEDDISASVVLPRRVVKDVLGGAPGESLKFVVNCERRLFQRPDDAIHRGLDRQTELDLSRRDNFISNFEPLTVSDARRKVSRVVDFEDFTPPMQQMLRDASMQQEGKYVVSSARPRMVDGKPTKNPRYLQLRPDLVDASIRYVSEMGLRLFQATPADQPVLMPVDAVLVGRRNNPPDKAAGIRALAVYNPIHYQELPELFMDFICSLTGKSPSTTGAGSEGALTKGPFNALRPIIDLNNALVSYILTGLGGFSTAAGYVGPNVRVDHDVSLLIPEIWCRLNVEERDPNYFIKHGYLEPLKDFDHKGEVILASRLGYRITAKFCTTILGKLFDNPARVFDDHMLQPEHQDFEAYVDGIRNITEAQQRVAKEYLDDGSIEDACPPLVALLHIMATGSYNGRTANDPGIRAMFTRDALLQSDWYQQRLRARQSQQATLWRGHLNYADQWLARTPDVDPALRQRVTHQREQARASLSEIESPAYLPSIIGTLGTDPSVLR